MIPTGKSDTALPNACALFHENINILFQPINIASAMLKQHGDLKCFLLVVNNYYW